MLQCWSLKTTAKIKGVKKLFFLEVASGRKKEIDELVSFRWHPAIRRKENEKEQAAEGSENEKALAK